jgi:hypothetical protein
MHSTKRPRKPVTLNDFVSGIYGLALASAVSNSVLAEAMKQEQEDRQKNAVSNTRGLLRNFSDSLSLNVRQLKALRKSAKDQLKKVKEQDLAFRYFTETGNPLPMCRESGRLREGQTFLTQCGYQYGDPIMETTHEAWNLPEGWKPASPVPKDIDTDDTE